MFVAFGWAFFAGGGGGAGAEGKQGWYELVYVAVWLNLSELMFLQRMPAVRYVRR